jgi:hypothetical protein
VNPTARALGGRFSFPALPEGNYVFHSDRINDQEGRSVVFVAEAKIHGQQQAIALSAVKTAMINGRVLLPPGVDPATPISLQIGADPRFDTIALGPSPAAGTNKYRTIRFLAWPGENGIVVRVHTPGLYLKAIRLGGIDITDASVSVANGADLDDLEVELTGVAQTLSGRVSTPSAIDGLVDDFAVVVFPVDRRLWASTRRTAIVRIDQHGEFAIASLPPGTYLAAVVPVTNGSGVRNPEFLESLQGVSQVFSLPEGAKADLVLTPMRRRKPGP